MRRRFAPVLFLLLAVLAGAATAQPWELRGLHGERLTDADVSRGNVIVVVWASWSPRGRGIAERVNAIAQAWDGRARIVTVNFQEEAPAVQAYVTAHGLRPTVFLDADGAFSKRYAIATLPGLVVFHGGNAVFKGKLPDDAEATIASALR